MKKYLIFIAGLLFFMVGCAQCLLLRSEYYDVTGRVIAPKPEGTDIPILSAPPQTSYQEIGVVRVLARRGISREAIDRELKRRARSAGADALIGAQYGEDTSNKAILCGKIFSTNHNQSAAARAIVYKTPESPAVPASSSAS